MEVYIIGSGGNSKIVIDMCILLNYKIVGIFDDSYDSGKRNAYIGCKIIGNINSIKTYSKINIINSLGNNKLRSDFYQDLKNYDFFWINCIHPNSYISPTAKLGKGNIICYGAVINSDTVIGNFNLINTCAIIEHDCTINSFNHFAPRSTLCGGIKVENLNLFGVATSVIPGLHIGNNNTIGSSTAVTKNIIDSATVVGVPGKKIK